MTMMAHPHDTQVRTASGLDVLAGIWLFISAFVIRATTGLHWSNGIVAVAVVILAAIRAGGAYRESWLSWINALLGLWVLISPWVISRTPTHGIITNNVITGIVIIVLAAWSALASGSENTGSRHNVQPM